MYTVGFGQSPSNEQRSVIKPKRDAVPSPAQGATHLKNLDKPTTNVPHSQEGEDHFFTLGERTYRVRGLARNTSFEVLKINLRLSMNDQSKGAASSCFYVDTFDFYNARHRKSFLHAAAEECRIEADVIKRDLGRILLKLEELQERCKDYDIATSEGRQLQGGDGCSDKLR